MLFDFGRISLAPGQSGTVSLKMDPGCKQAVSLVDDQGTRWMQPGSYTVKVGDLAAPATHALAVTGTRAAVNASCPL